MESIWETKWIEDIDYLKENLIKKHKNLFFNINRDEFEKKISDLKNIINELDYNEMKVEISRIVASVGDAHTSVIFPANSYIPLRFYWFNDGIYIINATEKYKELIGKKLLGIEGVSIENILNELKEIIPHENKYFLKAQSVKYMQVAEVLYGLVIADSLENIRVNIEGTDIEVKTVEGKDLMYVNNKLPIYARDSDTNLWYEYLEDKEELYIKYNFCREEENNKKIAEKVENIIEFIRLNNIFKVTIDLRNNLGGDSTLISSLLDYLKNHSEINRKENLKVIIGRETFSSGLLNAYEFKFQTNAKIVGEPSGGKPNCYGEILKFTLPNSKFIISYSTKYYKLIDDDNIMALYPDEKIYESIEDYLGIEI